MFIAMASQRCHFIIFWPHCFYRRSHVLVSWYVTRPTVHWLLYHFLFHVGFDCDALGVVYVHLPLLSLMRNLTLFWCAEFQVPHVFNPLPQMWVKLLTKSLWLVGILNQESLGTHRNTRIINPAPRLPLLLK